MALFAANDVIDPIPTRQKILALAIVIPAVAVGPGLAFLNHWANYIVPRDQFIASQAEICQNKAALAQAVATIVQAEDKYVTPRSPGVQALATALNGCPTI